ncbi:MAG: MBOAT family protein [Lachnospiraceae bacterium]|nr:MBOAT family protein [Lachnospiraceae bacterium]
MVFSSLEFLYWFFPIFFFLYFILPAKARSFVILAGSLVFYASGEPLYVFVMVGSILINHFLAQGIHRGTHDGRRKALLVLALLLNFGCLFFFKYLGFISQIFTSLTKIELPVPSLALPLGISFYTFQITSYLIDIYRRKYDAEKNFIHFAAYVSMFPQLIAGPIVSYDEVSQDMKNRKSSLQDIEQGAMTFTLGLAYKVLLANKIASLWTDVSSVGPMGINAATAWLGAWGYSMQIYFDFFGYSLMAIGLGRMMHFKFPENFDSPYISTSATEFWRRWHITLGRWFRNYVYIPLGGNKKGKARMLLNTFIVWFLTGLWHGADWNFIFWGLFFFLLLMIEKLGLKKVFDKVKPLGHLYVLFWIPISWLIFNVSDLPLLWQYLKTLFGISLPGKPAFDGWVKFQGLLATYWWLLLICIICATPLPRWLIKKFNNALLTKLILFALFGYCIYQIAISTNNPFLYFRF